MTQILYQGNDARRGMLTQLVRDTDGSVVISARQKTDAILDFNKRWASLWDKHAMRGKGRMVANLSMVEYWKLHRMGITRDRKAFLKYLSRRDTRHFRVDDGRPLA